MNEHEMQIRFNVIRDGVDWLVHGESWFTEQPGRRSPFEFVVSGGNEEQAITAAEHVLTDNVKLALAGMKVTVKSRVDPD